MNYAEIAYAVEIEPGFGSYLWTQADERMMPDSFGNLVIVPFCYGVWMLDAFDADL